MKINDVKHNHSLTDLLKILLFAILMLAPIGSVATRCLYVVCNKNAYQSYYGETINERSLNNIQSFVNDKNYQFNSNLVSTHTYSTTADFTIKYKDNLSTTYSQAISTLQPYNNETLYLRFRNSSDNLLLSFFSDNAYQSVLTNIVLNTHSASFDFELLSYNSNLNSYISYFQLYEYNKYSYLDNAFEYSVSQLENDQLFSWTSNTPVYTGVNAMCTQLGISGQAIPIILSYWLILTCIYVIIDIVIKLFTLLTHMISRKAT